MLRILFRDTSRYDLSHYENHRNRESCLSLCRLLDSLCQAYNLKNATGFFNILDRLKEDGFFLSLLGKDINRQNINSYLQIHTGFETDGASGSPMVWLERLKEYGNGLLASRNSSRRYIDDVIEYVEQNYMKDIGINSLAGQLNITPNYLSTLFHQETKLKFTDYIARTRISHARRLLSETSLTIREISEQVGYRSSRHFTNLFVKYTGEYPSKYRKERSSVE
jgi:two-component system response regulator YesN